MKNGLLQIVYANSFAGLNHEGLESEEEAVFLRLFPNSLIGKANKWYLDQTTSIMTNCDAMEENFLNIFFRRNKFMEAKTII